jgi:hypothetical protein
MTDPAQHLNPETKHLAEGEAALVLIESLIHLLIEKGLLSPEDIIRLMEDTVEAKREVAAGETEPRLSQVATGLLIKMANSFRAV